MSGVSLNLLELVIATTLVVLLTTVLICLWWVSDARKPEEISKPKETPKSKSLTFRVNDIPVEDADEVFDTNLQSIVGAKSSFHRHSIVAHGSDTLCATVSIITPLSGDQLVAWLVQNAKHEPFKYSYSCDFIGITPLYTPPDGVEADADIIVVPGLGANALGSWKSPSSNEVWLRDFLPKDLPNIRVLLYGYDTTLAGSASKQSIEDLGHGLLEQTIAFRGDDAATRPVILIGHSLGGLVIKEALILAHNKREELVYCDFSTACYGLLFFGVPNLGLRNPNLLSLVYGQPNEALVRDLIVDQDGESSALMKKLEYRFSEVCKDQYRAVTFYERKKSPTLKCDENGKWSRSGPLSLMVTQESATSIGLVPVILEDKIPLNRDHSQLVKYESRSQGDYIIVKERIRRFVNDAKQEVAKRFSEQGLQRIDSTSTYDCLRSLSYNNMESRRNEINENVPGSCTWFLEHETLIQWISQHPGLLWIKGKPGSGKSTLMKYALEHIPPVYGFKTLSLSFFFHGRGEELQRTPLGLFQSFLHQLLWNYPGSLYDFVQYFEEQQHKYGKYGEKWKWELQPLQKFFNLSLLRVLATFPVTIFIDALDECGEKQAIELIEYLRKLYSSVPTNSSLGIIFSCREYPILDTTNGLTMQLHTLNKSDISIYIQNRFFRSSLGPGIQKMIAAHARGIFLWTVLVVEQVLQLERKARSEHIIRTAISNIPDDLNALYDSLIQDMTTNRAEALKLMQWICFSKRPLGKNELQWALAIDPDSEQSLDECRQSCNFTADENIERRIQDLSCGLTEFIEYRPKGHDPKKNGLGNYGYGYGHEPEVEYLADQRVISGSDLLDESEFPEDESQEDDSQEFDSQEDDSEEDDSQDYNSQENDSQEDDFQEDDSQDDDSQEKMVAMKKEYVIQFIHQSVKDYFLERGLLHLSPLRTISSSQNLAAVAHFLLSRSCIWYLRKVDIFEILRSKNYPTYPAINTLRLKIMFPFLLYAVESWKFHVKLSEPVEEYPDHFLDSLDWVIDQPWQRLYLRLSTYGWEINLANSAAGYGLTKLLSCLLSKRRISIETQDNHGWTPLLAASAHGCEASVRLLLDRGAFIERVDVYGWTPLLLAAEGGHKGTVKILLDHGASINLPDDDGRTPLSHSVSESENNAVTQLLLDRGASINIQDKEGRTPLIWALKIFPDEDLIRNLVERGASINITDECGRTPLSLAAEYASPSTMELLLDRDVLINMPDNDGETPLFWATKRKNKPTIKFLLDRGATIEAPDNHQREPLTWAANRGTVGMVPVLLGNDASIDTQDASGATPLALAAMKKDKSMVQFLLHQGASAETADNDGRTPLAWAVRQEDEVVVQLLLDQGACIDTPDNDGMTPLAWATLKWDRRMVAYLLRQGASANTVDKNGRTPLVQAVNQGNKDMVQLLLNQGVSVNVPDNSGRSPLVWAAEHGDREMIKLLLDHAADIEMPDNNGCTALASAFNKKYKHIVQLLLDSEPSIDIPNHQGRYLLSEWAKSCITEPYSNGTVHHATSRSCSNPIIALLLYRVKTLHHSRFLRNRFTMNKAVVVLIQEFYYQDQMRPRCARIGMKQQPKLLLLQRQRRHRSGNVSAYLSGYRFQVKKYTSYHYSEPWGSILLPHTHKSPH